MFEDLGFDTLTAPQAAVFLGIGLGLAFGALAQITRFCFRRSVVGNDRKQAAGIWLTALASAVIGTQLAVAQGWIDFDGHRFHASTLPVFAIVTGGLMFGAGMVLARGCVSRLTVLGASGNMRALIVLMIVGVSANAAVKGVLAGPRALLYGPKLNLGDGSLAALPGGPLVWAALIAAAALAFAARSGARPLHLGLAALLGLLVPAGWVGTGLVLFDGFDPIPMQSLGFTSSYGDTQHWSMTALAVTPNFGIGLVGGVMAGAFLSALIRREVRFVSFESPRQTGRYVLGGMLMGIGGVTAGGCTVGAGLAGIPTLGVSAFVALAAIAAGGMLTHILLDARPVGPVAQPA